ncbi:membrane protein DedA with SNARE-associated domain [Spinactinospora alkalitolerans]|uniref:Membrane protein DedA with SNARE-associated domain n=1 Tax=Spinactinospora alkalitolerans TaxID=687207 RepID=A0A852U8V2_9ACTN|nr:hypothetical protein [Spinactinospora alkalitolerans]NYE50360.1 membrane protein DedA with SNARE-associated domain [Spinactinospora alkalitolerans]
MPTTTFLVCTALGGLIRNTAFVVADHLFGENRWTVERYVGVFSKAVVVTAVVAFVCFVVLRLREARRARADRHGAPARCP